MGSTISRIFDDVVHDCSNSTTTNGKETGSSGNPSVDTGSSSSFPANFKWIDGRKYHAIARSSYLLAADETELDRLTAQHFLLKTVWDGNFRAPVSEQLEQGGARILDVGCGSGSWTLEVAADFPESKVVGVDMVPIFPQDIKPENTTFLISNILDGLPFPDNTFDFVHMRLLFMALKKEQWALVISEIHRVTRPGGWAEFVEIDLMVKDSGPKMTTLGEKVVSALDARDLDPLITRHLKGIAGNVGFKNIQAMHVSVPYGKWGEHIGAWNNENCLKGMHSSKAFWTAVWGWSSDEFDTRLAEAIRENNSYKPYQNWHRVIAQKP